MNHGIPNAEQRVFALDFDDTYTADVNLWHGFVQMAHSLGHKVICITGRRESFEARRELESALPKGVAVHFAYDVPKRLFAKKLGIEVDVWIDDMPEMIAEPK